MFKFIKSLLVTVALVATPLCASAQTYYGPGSPAYHVCAVTGTTPVVCSNKAGHVTSFFNNSSASQTVGVTCYDNPSAASGTVVLYIGTPIGSDGNVILDPPGRPYSSGLTCVAGGAITTGQIEVNWF